MLELKLQRVLTEILSENFTEEIFNGVSYEDWNALFNFSRKHNLHIIVYTLLRKNKITVPDDISAEMKKIYHAACAGDFRRKEQLKEIIRIFNENSIEHIVLKGAHLVNSVYESSFTRLTADIDILVKNETSAKAYKLLAENGYENFVLSTDECEKYKRGFGQHYPPLHKAGCLPVELHTHLAFVCDVNLNGIRERSKVLNIDGLQSGMMAPEDLIMHISMHKFLQDKALNGLLGLYDIAKVIKNTAINWNTLKKLTSKGEYNNTKSLYVALLFCKKLMKTDINEEFLNSIKPASYTDKMEKLFTRLIFNNFSSFDKDAFSFGINMYYSKYNGSTVLKRLFVSPSKMVLYGKLKYDRGSLDFKNLSVLYTKRAITLAKRYGFVFIKHLFPKKDDNDSIKLGRMSAEFAYWLQGGLDYKNTFALKWKKRLNPSDVNKKTYTNKRSAIDNAAIDFESDIS